jgi:hypothetical protein
MHALPLADAPKLGVHPSAKASDNFAGLRGQVALRFPLKPAFDVGRNPHQHLLGRLFGHWLFSFDGASITNP